MLHLEFLELFLLRSSVILIISFSDVKAVSLISESEFAFKENEEKVKAETQARLYTFKLLQQI